MSLKVMWQRDMARTGDGGRAAFGVNREVAVISTRKFVLSTILRSLSHADPEVNIRAPSQLPAFDDLLKQLATAPTIEKVA